MAKRVPWYEIYYTKDGKNYQSSIRGKKEALRAIKDYNATIVNIEYETVK